eukprot:gene1545-1635_t
MESSNVDMSCQYAGRPTCCALTEGNMSSDIYPRKYEDMKFPHRLKNCEVKREYISSPYEQRHLMKALEIQQISSEDERRSLLLSFMFQDFPHVNRWLKRIKDHVVLSTSPIPNEDDFEYLSRFKVTRICGHNYINEYSWYEWIEPITIYARHPFSYTKCPPYGFNLTTTETGSYEIYYQGRIQTIDYNPALINTDYVLLQNALELNESNRYSMSRRDRIPKRYLFDTGSYTFDSSIMWFLCSYLQRGIDFDQIYGWEYTLIEPNFYWKRVPPRLLPFFHFFNIPITTNITSSAHVLRIIEQIVKEDDFIAFKLDIDTPEIEIPIVLELLSNHHLSKLIDDFFFELHFRCELLMYCGWGNNIPDEYYGLTLNRHHALQLFLQLRQNGIRAHIWP